MTLAHEINTPPNEDSEQYIPAAETVEEASRQARDAFYDIIVEPEFEGLLQKRNLSPEDTDKPRYWAAVADFARRASSDMRDNGVAEKDIVLKELYASTPDYVYAQRFLDHHRGHHGGDERLRDAIHSHKRVVSYYNGLIRGAAEEWPDMTPTALTRDLEKVANASLEHPVVKHNAPAMLRSTVRGAQHEIAFGQIADATGYRVRGANTTEDLKGIDYVITNGHGQEVYVDVKASGHELGKRGAEGMAYAHTERGKLLAHPLSDEEIGDSFYITDDMAHNKAAQLTAVLDTPQHHHAAYSSGR